MHHHNYCNRGSIVNAATSVKTSSDFLKNYLEMGVCIQGIVYCVLQRHYM